MTYSEKYKDCLEYIEKFWDKATVKPKSHDRFTNLILRKAKQRMRKNILNLPKSFIIPNATNMNTDSDNKPGWFSHIFYWDTFFMFRGLIRTKREWVLKSMVDNFVYLYDTYGIIPNFNSPASTGRSQPPLFTSMILDTYNGFYFAYLGANPFKKAFLSLDNYKDWLASAIETAKREYDNVWMDPEGFFHHYVKEFELNRYGDRDIGYAHSSELESGWDFTSRFYNRCDEFLPIDLNVFLYKYERDFAKIAEHLEETADRKHWSEVAQARRERINKYMWSKKEGFFFDYGYTHRERSNFLSLAGFTPLWAGLATGSQAQEMVKKLPLFENENGLFITAEKSMPPKLNLKKIPKRYRYAIDDVLLPKQWDYPNIWPPLEYLTIIGLLKYGYTDDAIRLMKKSLAAQSKIFAKYGTFFEKFNGLTGDISNNYHYEGQTGFGWTNAAFYRYTQILDAIESGLNIYTVPKAAEPPFKLSIPH